MGNTGPSVVSLGSINVDHTRPVTAGDLAELTDRFEWFPSPGETKILGGVPEELGIETKSVSLGGKGANQAVAAGRAESNSILLGSVGSDQTDHTVLGTLSSRGIDVSRVRVIEEPTGNAYIFVDQAGENRIIVTPGANRHVDVEYVMEHMSVIGSADSLLLQNEIPIPPMEAVLSALTEIPDRPVVIFDPAPVQDSEHLLSFDSIDVLTPNEQEYRALSPFLDEFSGTVIRKRGADDVIVENDQEFTIPPPVINPVDTTGAGDAFNGYLAAALAAGASLHSAVELASIAGALTTTKHGAQEAIPTRTEVESFWNSRH